MATVAPSGSCSRRGGDAIVCSVMQRDIAGLLAFRCEQPQSTTRIPLFPSLLLTAHIHYRSNMLKFLGLASCSCGLMLTDFTNIDMQVTLMHGRAAVARLMYNNNHVRTVIIRSSLLL